jgi:ABC-2 type transport system permease protein
MIRTIAGVTVRGVLGRRRSLLIVLFAAVPVVIALIVRLSGGTSDAVDLTADLLDALIVRTILPLVALILGTAVLGSELEDGTAVFLLVKPIERWRIVAAKLAVAAGMTAALVALVTLVTGLIVAAGRGAEEIVIAFTVAVAIGGILYSALFVALSVVTGRALILGLAYILIWEGALAGLLEGTQVVSIRQYTLAIAQVLAGGDGEAITVTLAGSVALVLSVVVFVLSFVVATRWLATYQVSGTD